ncbi:MAG: VanZ family protein [Solibacillus sp.]
MKKAIILTVVALIIVIYASTMTYEQQTVIPELRVLLKDKPLEGALSTLEIPYWGTIISIESRGYFYFIEFLIRKATHFIGYGILAVIFYFLYLKLKWRFPSIVAFVTIFIIACLDEYRQSRIPGRTGIFDDVLIDVAGALFFLLFVKVMITLKRIVTKKS